MNVKEARGSERLTPEDGRWSAHGVWVAEYCAEQPDEPEPLFKVDSEHNAQQVAKQHNELLDRVEQSERVAAELREENERLRRRIETHDEMRLAAYSATERDKARAECEALRQRIAAVRAQANEWRAVTPVGFYPEAGAYANAVECCGDALIDLLDDDALAGPEVSRG